MSLARTLSGAALVAALFVCATGTASAQTQAPSGTLEGGVVYAVHPTPGLRVAAIALWFRAPAAGFDAPAAPGISRLAAATVAASTPITGTPFAEQIERWGGRLAISAYPDSVAVTAMVPADHAAQAVRRMTAAYFAPVVTAGGLTVARRDVAQDALYRSYGPDALEDAVGAALFESGPLHDGTLAGPAAIRGVELPQVRAFAARAFRPANAILVLTGDVQTAMLREVATRGGGAPGAEKPAPQQPRAAAATLRREGAIEGTGLGWVGPPIANEADATALDFVADTLFAPKTGKVPKALAGRKAAATGRFVTLHDPGVFLVTVTGEDAAAALPIVRKAIADAAAPMDRSAFEAARAAFVYRLVSDMATPAELAETYGWYAVEGDPGYSPADGGLEGRYFSIVARLTPQSVAAVAARYLGAAPASVTFVKPRAGGSAA